MWRSLVSRLVRVQEASGSNPDTPTKRRSSFLGRPFIFIVNGDNPRPLGRHPRAVSAKQRASGGIRLIAGLALLRVRIPTLRPYQYDGLDTKPSYFLFIN